MIKQQQPDLTVTLGDAGVGGIAELPHVRGAPAQAPNASSGPSPVLIAALLIGLPALGAVGWYARRRLHLILILGFAVSAFFMTSAQQSEAGLAACILTARDVDVNVVGFNYLWYAGAACAGEDFEKAHISVDLQYYDWGDEEWRFLQVAGTATEYNDEDIIAWGANYAGPYLGINCRRIDAKFFFTPSGRQQDFTVRSNGECY